MLAPLAVSNKHAMIRGMPKVDQGDARMITRVILAMKWLRQKKHRTAWEE